MKKFILILPLLTGCISAQSKIDAAYLKADRETYEAMEAVIVPLTDDIPENDPDLSGVNAAGYQFLLKTWLLRIEAGEKNLGVVK